MNGGSILSIDNEAPDSIDVSGPTSGCSGSADSVGDRNDDEQTGSSDVSGTTSASNGD